MKKEDAIKKDLYDKETTFHDFKGIDKNGDEVLSAEEIIAECDREAKIKINNSNYFGELLPYIEGLHIIAIPSAIVAACTGPIMAGIGGVTMACSCSSVPLCNYLCENNNDIAGKHFDQEYMNKKILKEREKQINNKQ